jgi:signal transduction histidine kinase
LTAIIIQLRNADAALTAGSPGTAQKDVERAVEFARAGLGEMRRCVRAWRAQTPGGSDFATAVAQLVERVTSGTDLRTGLAVKGTPKKVHGPSAESMLRIVQEGLTNALRHARATRFDATIAYEPRALRVTLRDDGCGFDPARTHEGFGLLGIKERVAASRGQLTITSAIGRGTTTEIVLPYR